MRNESVGQDIQAATETQTLQTAAEIQSQSPETAGNRKRLTSRVMRGPFLLSVTTLFWFSLYTYPAILTPYLREMGASLTSAGLVIGSYGLTQTILRLPAGILSDRLRNKKIFVMAGLFFALISAIGLTLSRQLVLVLIFRALSGVAAAMWVQISTLYMSYFPTERSARAMSSINFVNSIGQMSAMLAGSLLAQYFGWTAAFLLAAAVAVAGFVMSCFVVEDRADVNDDAQPALTLKTALSVGRDKLLFWTSILALLSQLFNFATTQSFVPEYAFLLGADKAQIGLLSALAALPRAVAGLLGGHLLARWFKLRSLIFFGFFLAGTVTCLLPFVHSFPVLVVSQVIAGIGSGFQMTLLMAICTRQVSVERKASAMGFFQAVYGIGMVTGPVMIGAIADRYNLGIGFVLSGIICLLSAVLTLLVLE